MRLNILRNLQGGVDRLHAHNSALELSHGFSKRGPTHKRISDIQGLPNGVNGFTERPHWGFVIDMHGGILRGFLHREKRPPARFADALSLVAVPRGAAVLHLARPGAALRALDLWDIRTFRAGLRLHLRSALPPSQSPRHIEVQSWAPAFRGAKTEERSCANGQMDVVEASPPVPRRPPESHAHAATQSSSGFNPA